MNGGKEPIYVVIDRDTYHEVLESLAKMGVKSVAIITHTEAEKEIAGNLLSKCPDCGGSNVSVTESGVQDPCQKCCWVRGLMNDQVA